MFTWYSIGTYRCDEFRNLADQLKRSHHKYALFLMLVFNSKTQKMGDKRWNKIKIRKGKKMNIFLSNTNSLSAPYTLVRYIHLTYPISSIILIKKKEVVIWVITFKRLIKAHERHLNFVDIVNIALPLTVREWVKAIGWPVLKLIIIIIIIIIFHTKYYYRWYCCFQDIKLHPIALGVQYSAQNPCCAQQASLLM